MSSLPSRSHAQNGENPMHTEPKVPLEITLVVVFFIYLTAVIEILKWMYIIRKAWPEKTFTIVTGLLFILLLWRYMKAGNRIRQGKRSGIKFYNRINIFFLILGGIMESKKIIFWSLLRLMAGNWVFRRHKDFFEKNREIANGFKNGVSGSATLTGDDHNRE